MASDPNRGALAHAARAQALAAQSLFGPALGELVQALEAGPQVDYLWAQFADLIRFFNFRHPLDPRLYALLKRGLQHRAVDPGDLVRPISSTALSRDDPFADGLLLALLEETVLRDPRLEALLIDERRKALRDNDVPLERLVAIAHQCFNTEYVFAEDADEMRALPRPSADSDLRDIARYATYRPLHELADAERLVPRAAGTAIESLVRRQVVEPAEETRLKAGIESMGNTQSAVSRAVRDQYEANPYPRWRRVPAAFAPQADAPSRVLIAGCGTGQHAISTALRMPKATVLAIDLSLASLAYAKRKTTELGLKNIEFRQGDLLCLRPEHGRFDHVEACGVLHHLEDPLAGWRVLAALVEPGGSMRIALYSELGRAAVVRARGLIAERGFAPTPGGIRACRAAILERSRDELLAKLTRNEDFYSMSGCRDLLFHVQEHRFRLPQIKAMIATLGLEFTGFEFADSGRAVSHYRTRYPQDRSLTSLDHWAAFEQAQPDTFSRMYQFGVRKPR